MISEVNGDNGEHRERRERCRSPSPPCAIARKVRKRFAACSKQKQSSIYSLRTVPEVATTVITFADC
jgi:hypothetical protein